MSHGNAVPGIPAPPNPPQPPGLLARILAFTTLPTFSFVGVVLFASHNFQPLPVQAPKKSETEIITLRPPGQVVPTKTVKQVEIAKNGKNAPKVDQVTVLEQDATHTVYPIYFGTDRLRAPGAVVNTMPNLDLFMQAYLWALIPLFLVGLSAGLVWALPMFSWRRTLGAAMFVTSLVACGVSVSTAVNAYWSPIQTSIEPNLPRVFSEYRGDELKVGVCPVSVPAAHKAGVIELPPTTGTTFERRTDPVKHFYLLPTTIMDNATFAREFKTVCGKASRQEALVFVHGYNVAFEAAAMRAASLTHDLQFPGVSAFYSWPANGHELAYTWDETSVETAVGHLKSFLEKLAEEGELKAIHLIAHSMGSRCATAAVLAGLKLKDCRLDQFILAAPDIDSGKFRGFLPELTKHIGRLTLYASSKDRALQGSHGAHEYPRAGDSGQGIIVMDRMESIDASNVKSDWLGHSYVGDSPRLLKDLKLTIIERTHPEDKLRGLRPVPIAATLKYWKFPEVKED